MKIKNIHNAFTIVESGGHKIICDPWIEDGIFDGGWGIFPPVENIENYLDGTTHCFISHIHEDHFDLNAIKLLDRKVKFFIPDIYPNHVISNILKGLEFKNIEMLKPMVSYEVEDGLLFDVIPPLNSKGLEVMDDNYDGDLGFLSVDAGIMIRDKDSKIVLLSDNGPYELTDEMVEKFYGCDVLAFPFNGVADDYPVCFDNLTTKEKKDKSLLRQRKRMEIQSDSIMRIQPKHLIPYSSDIVILGKRAKDFVDIHPIEYIDRDLVSEIYGRRTKIPTHSIKEKDDIIIIDNQVTIIKGENKKIDFKSYGYSKYNEDENDKIVYSSYKNFEHLYENFKKSCNRMFDMMDKLKLKSNWTLTFYLTDLDKYMSVNLSNKVIYPTMNGFGDIQLCRINSEYLNSHFLFIHHWNNSIISYNLNWERKNDVFDYGLSKSLNFLHI